MKRNTARNASVIIRRMCSFVLVVSFVFAAFSCDNFSFYGLLGEDSDDDPDLELQISPVSATVPAGSQLHFYTRGGIRPYAYTLISGNGIIDEDTGVYVAPEAASVDIVRVVDAESTYVDAQIVVVE